MISVTSGPSWNSYDSIEVFWWTAEFPVSVPPELLLKWQDVVLETGERHCVFRIDEVPSIGYRRDRDGYIGEFIRSHPGGQPDPDPDLPPGFLLDISHPFIPDPSTVSTLLSYFDVDGEISETWVRELHDIGYSIGLPYAYFNPPLIISTEVHPMEALIRTQISTSVDIWFSWNLPMGQSVDGPMDNRVLSKLNGSRLNGFLAEVREATLAIGGLWESATWSYRNYPSQANEYGVILDAARPPS